MVLDRLFLWIFTVAVLVRNTWEEFQLRNKAHIQCQFSLAIRGGSVPEEFWSAKTQIHSYSLCLCIQLCCFFLSILGLYLFYGPQLVKTKTACTTKIDCALCLSNYFGNEMHCRKCMPIWQVTTWLNVITLSVMYVLEIGSFFLTPFSKEKDWEIRTLSFV